MKNYTFLSNFDGEDYMFIMPANSAEEAKDRMTRLSWARLTDEEEIGPIPLGLRFLMWLTDKFYG